MTVAATEKNFLQIKRVNVFTLQAEVNWYIPVQHSR